ncbi:MAG: hypothetical protein IKB64_08315 [Paludibacteraceae bacterium]|nr:hypothetical protein [Paludibacteraceae bacterium]
MSLLRIKQADGSWENIPAIKGADGIDGKDGAIQYTAGRYIQIDEDTQTINCTIKIGDLVIIDAVPVKDSTNVVSSGGVYDALEAKADKTDIAGLGSEAGFITNSVEDLRNYYKKSETYSQEEVNSLLGNLTRLTLQVVQELPEVGTEHIIYLVPNDESGNNVFEEWIFIQSKWEMIGTTEVDLSNYYTKEEVDLLLESLSGDDSIVTVNSGTVFYPNSGYYTSLSATEYAPIQEYITKRRKQGHQSLAIQLQTNGYGSVLFISKTSVHPAQSATLTLKAVTEDSGILYSWEMQVSGSYESDEDRTYTVSSVRFKRTTILNSAQILAKNNTTAFTPSGDYNPATKKYVDDKILDAIPQKSEMPTASADYLDKIYQYIGEDTEEFTKGFFYQCISETAEDSTITYSWSELKFNTENVDTSNIQEFPTIDLTAYLTYNETGDYISVSDAGKEALSSLFTDYYKRHNTLEGFNFIIRSNKSNPRGFVMMMLFRSSSNSSLIYSQIMFPADLDINYMSYTHCHITYSLNDDNTITISRTGSWGSDFTNGLAKYRIRDNVLAKDNTVSFTPTSDYHPATKKYVDDTVANAGAGSEGPDLSNYYTKEEIDALIPAEDELLRMPYIMVSYSLNNNDSKQALGKLFTDHYKKHNTISTLMFGMVDQNATYTRIFRWKNNGTGEGGVPTEVTFICLYFPSSNVESIGVSEYKWRFSFDADGNISVGAATITAVDTMSQSFLAKSNTTEFTPTADYHPATKKYVDDAVANAGSGEGTDLSNYYNKEEIDAKVAPLVSATDVLTKTNTTEYTPASAYHPATKQYVDQTVASSGAITEESDPTVPLHVKNITQDMIETWNNKLDSDTVGDAVKSAGFITSEDLPEELVVEGSVGDVYGRGNRILNPGKGYLASDTNIPNENAFAIGYFCTSIGFNTVAYGSGTVAEGYNLEGVLSAGSGSGSGTEFTFEGVINASHIRVGSMIYNDRLEKAYTVIRVVERESDILDLKDITVSRSSSDENVFSGNNYIINSAGKGSHSEGMECQAIGNCSHAEGSRAVATGFSSHAQNDATTSSGNYSHAGGLWSKANAECSIAHGRTLTNNVAHSALFGKYATLDADADADVVFAIGNGNSSSDQNIGLKLVGAKGEGKLYVENTLIGADPSTYAGFDNTKTQVLKHINGVFTWVDE